MQRPGSVALRQAPAWIQLRTRWASCAAEYDLRSTSVSSAFRSGPIGLVVAAALKAWQNPHPAGFFEAWKSIRPLASAAGLAGTAAAMLEDTLGGAWPLERSGADPPEVVLVTAAVVVAVLELVLELPLPPQPAIARVARAAATSSPP